MVPNELEPKGEGRKRRCTSRKEKSTRRRISSKERKKERKKVNYVSFQHFFGRKRAPWAENSDQLSQRCKEDIVHTKEVIKEEDQSVEGHKRGAQLSE